MWWQLICLHTQGAHDEISHKALQINVMSPGEEGKEVESPSSRGICSQETERKSNSG